MEITEQKLYSSEQLNNWACMAAFGQRALAVGVCCQIMPICVPSGLVFLGYVLHFDRLILFFLSFTFCFRNISHKNSIPVDT
jgi:hypothetical protein